VKPAEFSSLPFLELSRWQRLTLAAILGAALHFALGLEPVWWMAWLAPAALLALALRSRAGAARASTLLAALAGLAFNLPYLATVLGFFGALLVLLLQSLLWMALIMATRRIVLRYPRWWAVFAYPLLWAGTDTLMANLLPDGNWNSLAYTQAGFAPALQVTALFGTAGLVFVLSLPASALALLVARGSTLPHAWRAAAAAALPVAATLAYGMLRLQTPLAGQQTAYGLAAIDDAIGLQASAAYAAPIWQRYEQQVEALARQGARIIVLPEKIAMLTPAQALQQQQRLAALAARLGVWITAGVGTDDGQHRRNLAWLLSPQGTPAQTYQKHYLAPPEREFQPGSEYTLQNVDALHYGIAICKDMHFGALGRAYGQRGADVMLVLAWDFGADRHLAAAMTAVRGVENGYTVVRAAREGLLTVHDPYGRVLAQRDSAAMPGAAILATVQAGPQLATLYTRIGDAFGWLCAAIAAVLVLLSRRHPSLTVTRAAVAA
jgi:apolipoprotein N-acyltransferase